MGNPRRISGGGINPLTAFSCALAAWIVVLGINHVALSAAVIAVAWAASRRLAPILTTLALTAPVGASMALVHGLFGHNPLPVVPFFTSDGLLTAAELTLRFAALMAAMTAAAATTTITTLVKALQQSGVHPKLTFIVGTALQLLPEAATTTRKVKEARHLKGLKNTKARGVILPVIVATMAHAADKAIAVEVAGMDYPGIRTIYYPVPDSKAQQLLRWLAPIAALILVVIVSWI